MKLKTSLIILLAGATLTACSPTTVTAPPTDGTGSAAAVTGAAGTSSLGTNLGLGSLGQPDLFGEIKDIIGNEVTLLVLENPVVDATRVPGSGMGRGNGGADVPREYTGEEKTILIPVGTAMVRRIPQSGVTGGATGTGPVEEPLTLNGLSKGSTLKIYYYEGRDVIEKIVVQSPLP